MKETIHTGHPHGYVEEAPHPELLGDYEVPGSHGSAIAEETLLLAIARRQQGKGFATAEQPNETQAFIAASRASLGIADIKARLGSAYPELGVADDDAATLAFAGLHHTLPSTEGTQHAGHHHYENNDLHEEACTKKHGPLRHAMERAEYRISRRLRSRKAKAALALAFRSVFFVFCPGDDLAAIGLQAYGAVSGHASHENGPHATEKAILPRRPHIDFVTGKAVICLPVDPALPHNAFPQTAEGALLRQHTFDASPEPAKPGKRKARIAAANEARWRQWVAKKAAGPEDNPITQWAMRTQAGMLQDR